MRTRCLSLLVPLVCVLALRCGATGRDSLQSRLDAPVKDRHVAARDLPSALAQVASEFKIPMVVEWIDQPGKNAVQASLKNGTVDALIESVVASQPGYAVEITPGVVHVYNRKFLKNPQNFLSLRIKSFDDEQKPTFLVGGDLRSLVAQTVSPPPPPAPGHQSGGIIGSQGISLNEPKVTLKLENVTARQALEALARESDNDIWVVTFLGPSQVTPTGFRRTITLWNDSPATNEPRLDFFRWGQEPRRVLDATLNP